GAEDGELPSGDDLAEGRSDRRPRVAAKRRGESERREWTPDAVLDLRDHDPLDVERRLDLPGDPLDHILRHRTRDLARKRLETTAVLDDPCVPQGDGGVGREPLERAAVVGVERARIEPRDGDGRCE